MRANDIVIAAFPKSGVTFFGFLLTAARLHHNGIRLTPTFFNIDMLMHDVHKMGNCEPAQIWNDRWGCLIKSHSPWFNCPNVIYVLRNPIDAIRSHYHFKNKLGGAWNLNEEIGAWNLHVRSWLLDNNHAEQSIFVTQYEDLIEDPAGELEYLFDNLGMEWNREQITYAVNRASLEYMRSDEAQYAARNPVYAKFGLDFVRKTDERVVEEFTQEAIDMVRERTQKTYGAVLERLK